MRRPDNKFGRPALFFNLGDNLKKDNMVSIKDLIGEIYLRLELKVLCKSFHLWKCFPSLVFVDSKI